MIKLLLTTILIIGTSLPSSPTQPYDQDTERLAALDHYWQQVAKSVGEGDYELYKSLYHKDAVVIFATGENKVSISIADALANWKEDFDKTRSGESKGSVAFRLSQRIGNKDTAHETGLFAYSTEDKAGKVSTQYIHFEALFVKQNGKWLMTMEYQKERGSQAEWDALK